MSTRLLQAFRLAAGATIAVALGSTAWSQGADQTNLRGAVLSYSGNTLKVKSRQGPTVEVQLAGGWKITSLAKASLAMIKPGDYVGIASVSKAGGARALEVLIFPPALKGVGEGSHEWDLKPHSNMTNASVSNLVKGVKGQTVTLSYSGGQKTIIIPSNTPIVTFAAATPDDLKPGASVFIGKVGSGVKVTAHQIVVGKDGVVPPM